MDLSDQPRGPADLAGKRFDREFLGYLRSDVDRYLRGLAEEWDELLAPLRAAHVALEEARSSTTGERPYAALGLDVVQVLEDARRHADRLVQEAEAERESASGEREALLLRTEDERATLLRQAMEESELILARARREREEILASALSERDHLERGNVELRERLSRVLSDVSPLLAQLPEPQPTEMQVVPSASPDVREVVEDSSPTLALAEPLPAASEPESLEAAVAADLIAGDDLPGQHSPRESASGGSPSREEQEFMDAAFSRSGSQQVKKRRRR